ncbi:Ralf-like protein [Rhynchospora pubera]|uniref:Ralf-like protein n=1 Tax=Rhynchospora pubera TaxID=906938 RepID=A0AAV8DAN4_9POAL|nr:Ralf-like protein [Rhynchospora pubera]KAJ4795042.1 Ralf-like protein [Rhynchospora pubera]
MKTLVPLSLFLLLLSWQCNAGGMEVKLGFSNQPMEKEIEMELDSEINRRVLWDYPPRRYISYAALRGDAVPCERPGVPYYNCRSLPKANPYTRGCEIITLCARDSAP